MFTIAVRILSLLSFTVHAVIGCCAHHSHGDVHDKTCESNRECGFHQSLERHVHEVEITSSSCCHADEIATDGSDEVCTNSPEIPCDDSHTCNETICSFLAGASVSLDLDSSNHECFDSIDVNRCRLQLSTRHLNPGGGLYWRLGCKACVLSCAILQTWQI